MNRMHQRHRQKDFRRRNGEKAFLFDASLSKCLASVERDDWEWAIGLSGGNVGEAARLAGIESIPSDTRALWGKSSGHALDCYRQWMKRKAADRQKGRR